MLRQKQGESFDPNLHWTSPARVAAGYDSFDWESEPLATFEVVEPSRELRLFLEDYAVTESLSHIQTAKKIYLDVQAATKYLNEPLDVLPLRFEKVIGHITSQGLLQAPYADYH